MSLLSEYLSNTLTSLNFRRATAYEASHDCYCFSVWYGMLYYVTYNFSCTRDGYFFLFRTKRCTFMNWNISLMWKFIISLIGTISRYSILYIFILIFLSKYIHLLSVVFTTYENSQTVKIVNPLLYEYAAVNTIAFQLLLLCKEPLNLNHKPFKEPQFLIVNCRLQSFNLQET